MEKMQKKVPQRNRDRQSQARLIPGTRSGSKVRSPRRGQLPLEAMPRRGKRSRTLMYIKLKNNIHLRMRTALHPPIPKRLSWLPHRYKNHSPP